MLPRIIDAHIHIDDYGKQERSEILNEMADYNVAALIAVSKNEKSAHQVQALAKDFKAIKPAYGYHPEQELPSETTLASLVSFIEKNHHEMTAIGEVGLPFYLRQEDPGLKLEPYVELLEELIIVAKKLEKPIILHAVYEDARIACGLLEKHSIQKAQFHWFKGDAEIVQRLKSNGYHISITPDIYYKERTRKLIESYPLHLIMAETDGPWPFTENFKGQLTHPKMVHQVIRKLAALKEEPVQEVYETVFQTTKNFFRL